MGSRSLFLLSQCHLTLYRERRFTPIDYIPSFWRDAINQSRGSIVNGEPFEPSVDPTRKSIKIFYNISDKKDLPVPVEKRVFRPHPSISIPPVQPSADHTSSDNSSIATGSNNIIVNLPSSTAFETDNSDSNLVGTDNKFDTLLLTIDSVMVATKVDDIDNLMDSADVDGMET